MAINEKVLGLAVDNIVKFGDTDIFPFTIEKYVFQDNKDSTVEILKEIDIDFDSIINQDDPVNISTSSPVGYNGFRWVTQIDPIWNAYFLSLVLSIGKKIEDTRIPKNLNCVFSYRFKPDLATGSLFDNETGWYEFQQKSLEYVNTNDITYVLSCDISDFYNRIYHHRLENALIRLNINSDISKRIMKLLQRFSGTNSYGLPIGGPASRILAELALDSTDKILQRSGFKFARFVDDYYLFAKSREEAHSILNFLSSKLLKNEGLSLQKYKTQILSKSEFSNLVNSRIKGENEEDNVVKKAKFMSLPIRYDPYSPTAEEDYYNLRDELKEFDVLAMLNDELRKSRIHQQFSKQLLKTLKVLEDSIASNAFSAICDRIEVLYPIFSNLMMSAYGNYERLDISTQSKLIRKIQDLFKNNSYVVQIELNAAYALRVIGKEQSVDNEILLIELFSKKFSDSVLIKSLIMQIMTRWRAHFWLSDLKPNFSTMSKWERKIFIIASYVLTDEGRHWREHNDKRFSRVERLIKTWASSRVHNSKYLLPI